MLLAEACTLDRRTMIFYWFSRTFGENGLAQRINHELIYRKYSMKGEISYCSWLFCYLMNHNCLLTRLR
jgi:hypothetical protein